VLVQDRADPLWPISLELYFAGRDGAVTAGDPAQPIVERGFGPVTRPQPAQPNRKSSMVRYVVAR
jgi:hypothetical protein